MIRNTSTKITGKSLRKQIRKAARTKPEKQNFIWIPSGSKMFNLASSGKQKGAYRSGSMINLIGDSSSGKSILVLSGLAEVAANPKFKDYRLIYDDAEHADSFDHKKLFGTNFDKRLEGPSKEKDKFSTTIEEFFDYIMDAFDAKKPFIYVLDSFDSIDSDAEIEKELKNREHRKAGNLSKIKGSFQATKQKKASQLFRQICSKLKRTQSLLIIISQTRDNLDAFSFVKQYRSGGKALKFYASIEAWLTFVGNIPKTINKIKYNIGVNTKVKITKNKYTGKKKETDFPIYSDYGIDDISACIDYLCDTKYWPNKKGMVNAIEFKQKMTTKKLIQYIEEKEGRDQILFKAAEKCWNQIEDKLKLNRKKKYE